MVASVAAGLRLLCCVACQPSPAQRGETHVGPAASRVSGDAEAHRATAPASVMLWRVPLSSVPTASSLSDDAWVVAVRDERTGMGGLVELNLAGTPDASSTPSVRTLLGPEKGLHATSIASTRDSVYWTDFASANVLRFDRANGEIASMASAQHDPRDVAVARGALFWVAARDGRIMSSPLRGGRTRVWVDAESEPRGLLATNAALYWTVAADDGVAVRALDRGADAAVTIWRSEEPVLALASGERGLVLLTQSRATLLDGGAGVVHAAAGHALTHVVPLGTGLVWITKSRTGFEVFHREHTAALWRDHGAPVALHAKGSRVYVALTKAHGGELVAIDLKAAAADRGQLPGEP